LQLAHAGHTQGAAGNRWGGGVLSDSEASDPPHLCQSLVVLQEMKKQLLTSIAVIVIAILALAVLSVPINFHLQSLSPSGTTRVAGLEFQDASPHPLDGSLRLFVWQGEPPRPKQMVRQTSIPFSDDLSIGWRESGDGGSETFVIYQKGREMMTFEIADTQLKCIHGEEYLVPVTDKGSAEQGGAHRTLIAPGVR
jgi:hypothetical protein